MTLHGSPLSSVDRRREREMQCELIKFHRNQTTPTTTSLTKKRTREPRVEVATNPFCAERQLADMYQQLNMNKNPRFYSVSVQDCVRVRQNSRNYSCFSSQAADKLASSHFDAHARAEFLTLPPATSYAPAVAQFTAPKVVSVDSTNMRQHLFGELSIGNQCDRHTTASIRCSFPPGHDQYSAHLTSRGVTFGHRPNSAARMFDHLSNSVSGTNSPKNVRKKLLSGRYTSTPARTGMSVMELAQLLALKNPANSCFLGDRKSSKDGSGWKEGASETFAYSREAFDLDTCIDDEFKRLDDNKKKAHELELEKGFINYVYNPPREAKPCQFSPPVQTTAQLIDKYRKLAVGKLPGRF